MNKHYIIAILLCIPAGWQLLNAQRAISSFREIKITQGESASIGGAERSEPDIYYVPEADGTFEAVRLTVAPAGAATVTAPYLYMNTPNSIRVCWKTSVQADGAAVRYGTSSQRLDKSCVPASRKIAEQYYWNTAVLDQLAPDTEYFYRVESNGTTSDVYRFRTMPPAGGKSKTRVLFIGDHQRNEHSDYEWMLNAARRTVKEKYGDAPFEDNIRFLMNVGDQVDRGHYDLYEKVHLYKSRSVSPVLPIMTAVGNHECKSDPELSYYNMHYDYGELSYQGISSGTANYYAYQAGCALFVVINSDEPTAEQKMWVRKVISAASSDETVDFVVSVQHRPLYAEQYTNDISLWMRNEIMPILSSTPKHVLNCGGHHHLYARGQMTDTPVYHIISGGGVGTSASGYEQLWGQTPDNRNHDEVQKTLDLWTYQLFEFDPVAKEMTVETYSIGNSRLALDNVLVDRFSRKTNHAGCPAVPALSGVYGPIRLPYTFSQSETVSGLHSSQYQIARDAGFTDLIIDKVVTHEDMYGVDEKYMPLDLNQGLDLTKYVLPDGTLPNGTYYIRVRNRNMNLDWSAYSEPVAFAVEGAAEPAGISAGSRLVLTGTPLTLSYKGAPVGTDAWIGVYADGKSPGTSDKSYKYTYTDAASGKWDVTIDKPGVYFAVLFKDGGYTEITDRVRFVVNNNCDDSNPPQLQTDRIAYDEGSPIVVNYNNITGLDKDWIGIYERSMVPASSKCPTYRYAGEAANGSLTLNVPGTVNYSSPLAKGLYFVGYFNTDGYHEPAGRQYFIVGKPVMVDTEKKVFTTAEHARIVYEGAPDFTANRISIHGKDGLCAQIPISSAGGTEIAPLLPEGDYEICIVTTGDAEISPRIKISVTTPAIAGYVPDAGETVTFDGNTFHITSPSGLNRINIFSATGSLVASCSTDGQTDISLPAPPGNGIYFVSVNGKKARKFICAR